MADAEVLRLIRYYSGGAWELVSDEV